MVSSLLGLRVIVESRYKGRLKQSLAHTSQNDRNKETVSGNLPIWITLRKLDVKVQLGSIDWRKQSHYPPSR